ncbi:MAG TPA: hypothetical protein VFZ34_26535 [Blastocatellia bacterium]|nr:hypothetical protein [Blastocatellia bacterium]
MNDSNSLWLAIVLGLLCLAFAIFVWKDGTGFRHRTDAREAKKSEDTRDDPMILDKEQQPAELQVGQQGEIRNPRRFVPDQQ